MAPEDRTGASYTAHMRVLALLAMTSLTAATSSRAAGLLLGAAEEPMPVAQAEAPRLEPRVLLPDAQGPMVFDGPIGGVVGKGLRPAYRLAEGAADQVYDVLRRRLLGSLLPGRLTRGLQRPPERDSYAAFERALKKKEERFAGRLLQRYPRQAFDGLESSLINREERLREWRSWALEEQQAVVVSAFEDALLDRYGMNRFGRYSEDYARDRRNWDPGFLAMAGVIGGAFAYANGIQAEAPMGPVRVQLGLRAGYRILESLAAGGRHRFGHVQLAYRNVPVQLGFEWAVDQGRVVRDAYGLRYEKRF